MTRNDRAALTLALEHARTESRPRRQLPPLPADGLFDPMRFHEGFPNATADLRKRCL